MWRVHKSSYGCQLQIAQNWWNLLLIAANWQPFIPPSRIFNAIDTGVYHVYQNAVEVSSVEGNISWGRHPYLSLQYQHSSHHRHSLFINYWYLGQPKTLHPTSHKMPKLKSQKNIFLIVILIYITQLGASFTVNLSMRTGDRWEQWQLRKRITKIPFLYKLEFANLTAIFNNPNVWKNILSDTTRHISSI